MFDLSIIIVTYNSAPYLGRLLTSIKRSPDKLAKQVVVIDNASADDSATLARKHSLRPTVIRLSSNLGLSKAINLGLTKAQGEYLLLLNPDTQLVGNCLSTLYQFARTTSPLGALAPRLLDPNGRPQASVFRFPTVANAIRHYFFNCSSCFNKYLPRQTSTVDVAVMAAFFFPRTTLDQIGPLDERFFLYYEDIEFCRRLRRAHLPVYYLPSAKVKHVHGASGHFKFHLKSPLVQSARIYHGVIIAHTLNSVLWLGQKWQRLQKLLSRK